MVFTFKALNLNVSAEPDYLPFIAAAGVLLFEANHITQLYPHNHSFYLKKRENSRQVYVEGLLPFKQ